MSCRYSRSGRTVERPSAAKNLVANHGLQAATRHEIDWAAQQRFDAGGVPRLEVVQASLAWLLRLPLVYCFAVVLGRGLDYASYRARSLALVRERYYRIPHFLPVQRCYFFERYFPG